MEKEYSISPMERFSIRANGQKMNQMVGAFIIRIKLKESHSFGRSMKDSFVRVRWTAEENLSSRMTLSIKESLSLVKYSEEAGK
jgi:hypothetical protein